MNTYHLNSFSVHTSCNTPQNKLCLSFRVFSDVAVRQVSFYEHNGSYWFCIEADRDINSIAFVSLRNCFSAFRCTIKFLGFRIEDECALNDFVCRWERSLKSSTSRKGVA